MNFLATNTRKGPTSPVELGCSTSARKRSVVNGRQIVATIRTVFRTVIDAVGWLIVLAPSIYLLLK